MEEFRCFALGQNQIHHLWLLEIEINEDWVLERILVEIIWKEIAILMVRRQHDSAKNIHFITLTSSKLKTYASPLSPCHNEWAYHLFFNL